MKIVEFVIATLVMISAVGVAFGAALAVATIWLRAIVGAVTRNSYNVSSVPDSSAAAPSSS